MMLKLVDAASRESAYKLFFVLSGNRSRCFVSGTPFVSDRRVAEFTAFVRPDDETTCVLCTDYVCRETAKVVQAAKSKCCWLRPSWRASIEAHAHTTANSPSAPRGCRCVCGERAPLRRYAPSFGAECAPVSSQLPVSLRTRDILIEATLSGGINAGRLLTLTSRSQVPRQRPQVSLATGPLNSHRHQACVPLSLQQI